MGVKTLWGVLECCGETVSLDELRGQTLAIDLAGWVVQNNQCRGMTSGGVARPHLRNVFFRTTALLALGVRPVFVMDGAAPALKRGTLEIRKAAAASQASSSQSQAAAPEVKSLSRTRLKGLMNECKFLLAAMGVTCLQGRGEGEALCAQLDAAGKVDAVVTDDSDAFCYGARTVLRNFSVQAKTVTVERYRAAKLESGLGLDRSRLVAAAVLLGCDFLPAGVAGVGKESALQLFRAWPAEWDALKVLEFWVETGFRPASCDRCEDEHLHCSHCVRFRTRVCRTACVCRWLSEDKKVAKLEASVKKKCLAAGLDWWREEYPKVVAEFGAAAEEPLPDDLSRYKRAGRPNVPAILSVLTKKLTWVEEYAQLKVIPLAARWQAEHAANGCSAEPDLLVPVRILKKRVSAGVASLSVEWRAAEGAGDLGLPDTFEAIVPTSFVEHGYPELYSAFVQATAKPKRKKAQAATRKACKAAATAPAAADTKENDVQANRVVGGDASQKAITNFFSQRRKPLSSSSGQNKAPEAPDVPSLPDPHLEDVAEEEEEAAVGANLVDDGDDLSDDEDDLEELSFLVDQVLGAAAAGGGKEAKKRTLDMAAFATSTPGRDIKVRPARKEAKAKSRDPPPPLPRSVFSHKNEAAACDIPDDFEDSFDRMCL